jgi:pyruvate formate lyase activating enzyme
VVACPAGALEQLGREIEVAELVREVLKDRVYYEKSGGGVTLSGGEPTGQPGFTLAVMQSLQREGIRIALDTCGLCSRATLEQMLPYVDLVLFDLKLMDDARHRQSTGQSNEVILANLTWLAEQIRQRNGRPELWIRTPIIPGATDDDANLLAIGQFLKHLGGDVITRWELCSFNNLCRDKYHRLGLDWQFETQPLLTAAHQAAIHDVACRSGLDPLRIFVTGASREEED